MVSTPRISLKTELKDRVLWFDGDTSVSPDKLVSMLLRGVDVSSLHVLEITPEVEQYNRLAEHRITVKDQIRPLSFDWKFNKAYQLIDVEDFVYEALQHEIKGMTKEQKTQRVERTVKELALYRKQSLITVLKLMIFIIDTFEQQGIVWGVGRGSSVSSYVLFLIGVHDVDSVEYDLPIEDFLHTK